MWGLLVAMLLVVGLGCGCHTADQTRPQAAPVECTPRTEATMDQIRREAVSRAEQWLAPVEYSAATLGPRPALAVLSYPEAEGSLGKRSFVYDDALALLWFAWTGDEQTARGLAETLIYLQNADGSWGFSFSATNPDDYQASYVRSGAVAWAAHALGYYAERYGQPRAIRAARRGADFLERMRIGEDTAARGLVSAGRGTPNTYAPTGGGPPLRYAVSEHQFDAQIVLERFAPMGADRLAERMLEVLWLEDQGRFAVAASEGVDRRRALDAAGAWGALWLLGRGDDARARRSFEYSVEQFRTEYDGMLGFRPYRDAIDGYDPELSDGHFFVEGTMSMGLAAHRLGDEDIADQVLQTGIELGCRGPMGLTYSNVEMPGFSTRAAAASTLWFLFLEREMRTGQTAPLFDVESLDAG